VTKASDDSTEEPQPTVSRHRPLHLDAIATGAATLTNHRPHLSKQENRVRSDPLPTTLKQAVQIEFDRAFHAPFDRLIAVSINAVLMSSAWFLLPPKLKASFFTIHGSLAFAAVLCAWMYADVPATNVIAPDRDRMVAANADAKMIRRLLDAKMILLWCLVTPFCLVVALFNGFASDNVLATVYSMIWIAIVPPGFLAIAAWMGIVYPYHQMPVRYRLSHRRPFFRMWIRWVSLITLPYVVVPMLGMLLMAPSLLLWGFGAPGSLSQQVPHDYLGFGIVLVCVVAAGACFGGRWVGDRLFARRRAKLLVFLDNPTID